MNYLGDVMTKHALKAIIYDKRGRVLAIGENSYIKTHPLQAKLAKQANLPEKIYIHAELSAIIKCIDLTQAHRMFISRHDYLGNVKLAKPCKVCELAIQRAGIRNVEYTTG